MIRYPDNIKKTIQKLNKVTDRLELVDFLRGNFQSEYSEIFEEASDTRDALYKFQGTGLQKYGIDFSGSPIERLKMQVFFENILTLFEGSGTEAIDGRIKKAKKIYNSYKSLQTGQGFNLTESEEAFEAIGLQRCQTRDLLANLPLTREVLSPQIEKNHLLPFMKEYENYLSVDDY